MKASTKRILSILFSGVFFIGTFVVYGSFIRPTLTDISTKRGEIASKESLFASQANAVTQVQNIISQMESTGDFNKKVEYAIPRSTAVTDALYQVYAISQNTQTDLTKFSVEAKPFVGSSESIVKPLGTVNVDMEVRGEYKNIKSFLESIETNVRVMNVAEVTITPVEKQTSTRLYALAIKVEMYFQE